MLINRFYYSSKDKIKNPQSHQAYTKYKKLTPNTNIQPRNNNQIDKQKFATYGYNQRQQQHILNIKLPNKPKTFEQNIISDTNNNNNNNTSKNIITTENLILRSAEGNECNLYYSDNERTNVMFVIDRQERKAKIYLNGVMCEAFHLNDYSVDGVAYLEDFTVNSNIILGGKNKNGYSKIRNLRVYQVALTTDEIINNWISSQG